MVVILPTQKVLDNSVEYTDNALDTGIGISDTVYNFNTSRIYDIRDFTTMGLVLRHIKDTDDTIIYITQNGNVGDAAIYVINANGTGKKLLHTINQIVYASCTDAQYIYTIQWHYLNSDHGDYGVFRYHRIDGNPASADGTSTGYLFNVTSSGQAGFGVHDNKFYFIDSAAKLFNSNLDGTSLTELVDLSTETNRPRGITFDATKIYILNTGTDSVLSLPLTNFAAATTTVFTHVALRTSEDITTDGTFFFVIAINDIERYDLNGNNKQRVIIENNATSIDFNKTGDIVFSLKYATVNKAIDAMSETDFVEYAKTTNGTTTTIFQDADLTKTATASIHLLNLYGIYKAMMLQIKSKSGTPLLDGTLTLKW